MPTHWSLIAGATVILLALFPGTAPAPALAGGEVVDFRSTAQRGTIVVRTAERRLYLVLGQYQAIRYTVGVGRIDRQWIGTSFVRGKHVRPNWAPPAAVRRDQPNLPEIIPGGAPNNPMGAAALTLAGSEYAIHGTNAPESVGGFVSYGCIRMSNADITDLYKRVRVGTRVVVER